MERQNLGLQHIDGGTITFLWGAAFCRAVAFAWLRNLSIGNEQCSRLYQHLGPNHCVLDRVLGIWTWFEKTVVVGGGNARFLSGRYIHTNHNKAQQRITYIQRIHTYLHTYIILRNVTLLDLYTNIDMHDTTYITLLYLTLYYITVRTLLLVSCIKLHYTHCIQDIHYMHTYIHTLHCITLHYITLH